jgi:hypothetical protein
VSAEAAAISRTWKVGSRTVTLTIPRPEEGRAIFASCEWSPDAPARLTPAEWTAYRQGRHTALLELASELGVTIGVLEA